MLPLMSIEKESVAHKAQIEQHVPCLGGGDLLIEVNGIKMCKENTDQVLEYLKSRAILKLVFRRHIFPNLAPRPAPKPELLPAPPPASASSTTPVKQPRLTAELLAKRRDIGPHVPVHAPRQPAKKEERPHGTPG